MDVLEGVQVAAGRPACLRAGDVEADHAVVAVPDREFGDLQRARRGAHRGEQRVDLCPGPAPKQQFGFFFPPDEGGQPARVQGVKAAPHGTRPQRSPGPCRPGDPLKVPGPEVLHLEEIAEQPSRAVGDDDGTRLGQSLQARREVWRLADDRLLLCSTRADQVADHDKPGGDADPHLQRSARAAVVSFGAASTRASPACTACSASCSWASG